MLEDDGGYKNLELHFTGELIDSPKKLLTQGIAFFKNFAHFKGCMTPPSYVAALEIYASAF